MWMLLPEMIVGMLLECVCNSANTPKGGLKALLKAHAAHERGEAAEVVKKKG